MSIKKKIGTKGLAPKQILRVKKKQFFFCTKFNNIFKKYHFCILEVIEKKHKGRKKLFCKGQFTMYDSLHFFAKTALQKQR